MQAQPENLNPQGFENFYQKTSNSIQQFWTDLHISSRDVITYVSCFGAGFLVGVLFKRYGKWIVTVGISMALMLLILDYVGWITIHAGEIRSFLGLQAGQELADISNIAKKCIVEVVITGIAILIGFKLG